MKSILAIIITAVASFFLFHHLKSESNNTQEEISPIIKNMKLRPSLNIVYDQDVTGSIKKNGVELISSSLFIPYFNAVDRNINLNFGCISDLSARKLISVSLPAITFSKPAMPDLSNASITEKQKLKELYIRDLKRYELDSSLYFSNRNNRILEFTKSVDSLIGIYRNKLTSGTDLTTAINIADKAFNFTGNDSAQNILILNSDGIDTYNRAISKMKNSATVILVNAGANNHTSIDSILTITLQSSEQAIQFSLNINHNKN